MKLRLKSAHQLQSREVEVDSNKVTIGRDPTCNLALPDEDMVSGRHAQIEQNQEGVTLTDLDSMNGTYLNGRRLDGPVVLCKHDWIQLGQTGPMLQLVDVHSRPSAPIVPATVFEPLPPLAQMAPPAVPAPGLAKPVSTTRAMLIDMGRQHRKAIKIASISALVLSLGFGVWLVWLTLRTEDLESQIDNVRAKMQDHDTAIGQLDAKQVDLEKQTREMYRQIADLDERVKKTAPANRKPEDIYKLTVRSCAWILSKHGAGTGCLVDRERRLVVTAYHVIHGYSEADVVFPRFLDGKVLSRENAYVATDTIKATVWASDPARDLAVLQVDSLPDYIPALALAPESANQGQRVHTIGAHPEKSLGLWVYSQGHVREAPQQHAYRFDTGQDVKAWTLRTTNPINRGDSGGPVVNDECQLAGIVSGSVQDVTLVENIIDIRDVRDLLSMNPASILSLERLIDDTENTDDETEKGDDEDRSKKTKPIFGSGKYPKPNFSTGVKKPSPSHGKGNTGLGTGTKLPNPLVSSSAGKKTYPTVGASPQKTNPTFGSTYDKTKKNNVFAGAGSGKVHVLLLMDTTDPKIGQSVRRDERRLKLILQHGLHPDNRDITTMSGSRLTRYAIVDYYRRLHVRPNDAVFCYFSGHGCCMRGTAHHFFSLSGGKDLMYRNDVMNLMASKRPRLNVLISDSCASFVDFNRGDVVEPMASLQEERKGKLFPLFFQYQGFINWNSSSPDEATFDDIFTPAFCQACSTGRLPLTWPGVWQQTYAKTSNDYQHLRARSPKNQKMREQPAMRPCRLTPDYAYLTF